MVEKAIDLIGESTEIKGNITGDKDLTIEGTVEGKVELQGSLTVEPSGVLNAEVNANSITVIGELSGDATAEGNISLVNGCKVSGTLAASEISLEDGARFKGTIEMEVDIPDDLL